jgi:hypothetical protein
MLSIYTCTDFRFDDVQYFVQEKNTRINTLVSKISQYQKIITAQLQSFI